jgi:hypothetical protein
MIRLKKSILTDEFPKEWEQVLEQTKQEVDVLKFRNLQHFKEYLKTVKPGQHGRVSSQEQPETYDKVVKDLIEGNSTISQGDYEIVRQQVKSVLQKKGLISENVYVDYEYDVDGEFIDIAAYLEGNPECMLKPKVAYKNYFHELFINVSFLGDVDLSRVKSNLQKLLATIQLLEQENIFIKVNLISASENVVDNRTTQVIIIPLWNHREVKTIEEMSSIFSEHFFRTVVFGIREHEYGEKLYSGYGRSLDLPQSIAIKNIDVALIAEDILSKVITPGTR